LTLKKEPLLITKVVFTAAITLGAALALATPVSADPGSFGALGCSCTRPIDIPQGKLAGSLSSVNGSTFWAVAPAASFSTRLLPLSAM
jgi:hypothetical protein